MNPEKAQSLFIRQGAPVPVNKIIPISTVDGPGARTALFLQGCNLACAYCHNPETQNLCIHCGICVPGCPTGALTMENGKVVWDPKLCIDCDQCIQVCPHNASPKVQWLTARQAFAQVSRNQPFIRGITASGGECTLYPEFLTDLFTLARQAGLTTLMDANGTVDLAQFHRLLAVTDGVMLDLKAWDEDVFHRLTKRRPTGALVRNLNHLAAQGKLEEIRLVCHEDWVDVEAALKGVAQTLGSDLKNQQLKLIAFRPYGVTGPMKDLQAPSAEQMDTWRALALDLGFGTVVLR